MIRNRVLLHIPRRNCPCCDARALHKQLADTAERLEELADDSIEFIVPSVNGLLGESRDELGERLKDPQINFYITAEPTEPANIDTDLTAYAIRELKGIARRLMRAARAIERTSGP